MHPGRMDLANLYLNEQCVVQMVQNALMAKQG